MLISNAYTSSGASLTLEISTHGTDSHYQVEIGRDILVPGSRARACGDCNQRKPFSTTSSSSMRIWTILCIPLSVAIRVSATQAPFLTAFSTGLENAFDFSPFGSLEQLSFDEFTTLRHPLVPDYGVRVKKSGEFCDGTVK